MMASETPKGAWFIVGGMVIVLARSLQGDGKRRVSEPIALMVEPVPNL